MDRPGTGRGSYGSLPRSSSTTGRIHQNTREAPAGGIGLRRRGDWRSRKKKIGAAGACRHTTSPFCCPGRGRIYPPGFSPRRPLKRATRMEFAADAPPWGPVLIALCLLVPFLVVTARRAGGHRRAARRSKHVRVLLVCSDRESRTAKAKPRQAKGQSRPKQTKTGQTGQNRLKQAKTGQNRLKQAKTGSPPTDDENDRKRGVNW